MIGTVTPTIRPISGANMPPALTTTSARISWRSPRVLNRHAGDPAAVARRCQQRGCGYGPGRREPGPRRQRQREPRRVQPAIGRQPDRAKDAIGRHQREAVLGLPRRDEVERQSEGLGPASLASSSSNRPAGCQPQGPDLMPRRVRAGLGLQSPVQVGAVHHHFRERHGAAQLADEAGRVEGRAGGELRAIDQDDVRPAALCQVIGDGRPADAAADDHRPGVLHIVTCYLRCRSDRRRTA